MPDRIAILPQEQRSKVYLVKKQLGFCYGHRLLDYAGKCRNLHGHNGLVEVEIEAASLDDRAMVADFGDIKRIIKDWIDENLDHRMLLRKDDPVASLLAQLGEPVFLMEQNPTAESIAQLILEQGKALGLPVSRITLWETPSSSASVSS